MRDVGFEEGRDLGMKGLKESPRPQIPASERSQEDITVVIPTLGRPLLQECLNWIANGDAWPAAVIVVDQGRKLAVAGWLEQLQSAGLNTCYVPSRQHGRAAGINRGLEQVKTRFVAIIDDDCFVTADWLARMVSRLRQEPGVIVTGRVEQAGDDEVAFSVVTAEKPKRYERPSLKAHPFIGGNVGMAMSLVERIGLFDEHPCLQSAEDSDYGYRALRLGIPIVYDPDIALRHFHWRDAGQRAARYRDYARSQGGFYGKYLFGGDWLIPLQAGRDLARGPVRWLRGILRRDPDMIDRGRADTLGLLPGIIAGLKRAGIRRLGDEENPLIS
jgi:GT2 family glycosyltransferase